MHITIIAPGSRGDIQPYIALGVGLKRSGHVVRTVTNKAFTSLLQSYGLEIWPIDIDVQAALQSSETSAAIEGGGVLASFKKLSEISKRGANLLVQTGLEAAEGADVILSGFGGILIGASLAEKLGLPFVQAYNVPLTPTAAFPGALFPHLSGWPRSVTHRLSHWLTRQVFWQAARMAGNSARMGLLGLPSAPLLGMFDTDLLGRGPLLYGFSPSLIPRPADWDEQVQITGYWFTDEPNDWSPPDDLVHFLERGPSPVYIGFGSMSSEQPEHLSRLVLDTLARHQRRAIISSGWAGLFASSLPDNVHVVDSVPHSWLFPRVAAVVHHGGAGTTAAGVRAGVPSVIVPFHGDQPFWGHLVETTGIGPKPIPRKRLTSERLANTIEEALQNEDIKRRAAQMGTRVRSEDGVAAAVTILEQFQHSGFR
jgi:sterol 3beta-glucosyltransferase